MTMALLGATLATGSAWWDKDWTARKSFTIDPTAQGGDISEPVGPGVVLVRLHSGNFNFGAVKEDGSDLRFVAEDDKTVLPHQIEKWDGLLNEAFVWVKAPEIKPGAKATFWLYTGNPEATAPDAKEAKGAYDADTVLVYHFAAAGAPQDASEAGNTAENAGTASEGAIIGGGLRLLGANPLVLPGSSSLEWSDGQAFTWSAWIKESTPAADATLFNRMAGGNGFRIGVDNGAPFVEVTDASGVKRTPAGQPLPAASWKNLAVVSDGAKIKLLVDGAEYAALDAKVPAINGPSYLGATGPDATGGFVGELDELVISKIARPAGWVKFTAINQGGSDASTKLLVPGEDEGGEGHSTIDSIMEHVSIFGDISKSLTFDGWAVIVLCSIMAILGWGVAVQKFLYLNRVKKGTDQFIQQWEEVSSDLTKIDHADEASVKALGGASVKQQKLMLQSPLYHIYHIGSKEISHRIKEDKNKGLSARSIQAIRASLEGGLVREVQNLNGKLVFLTISIAGGPYLGLLGTVIGVMITFATIAKTGEVEVNSIAPGIAGALLATVAGLLVAIPALFAYSYLSTRIKETVSTMQTFIDEFVTKMAEFYPTPE